MSLHEFLKRVDGAYISGLDQLVIKELEQSPRQRPSIW